MTHKYTAFDTIPLHFYSPVYQHDPAPASPGLRRTTGGYVDAYGSAESDPLNQMIPVTGVYVGETTYLVDEAGNRFVDEAGNAFIFGNASTMLRSQVTALTEKTRQVGQLWRVHLDDETVREWKTARLMQVRHTQRQEDLFIANITANFEPLMANWHAETQTVTSSSVTAGTPKLILVENAGETVEDGVVTVTRTSGTVTAFSLACTTLGISWVWTGSIASGEVVTVNDGDDTVISSNAAGTLTNAYSGFSRPGHAAKGFLTLPRGTHLFYVTALGGNISIAFKHYTQVK
jgi:hypothetical protein